VLLGRWWGTEPPPPPRPVLSADVRLGAVRGEVTVRTPDGRTHPTDGAVPLGSTVATNGPGASAVLFYPNGTNVGLTDDSAVTLGPTEDRLRLDRGAISADVRPPLVGGRALTLSTAETVLGASGSVMTLVRSARVTEVGVQRGLVSVTAPTGAVLGEVRDGELFTVRAGGDWQKQKIPDTSTTFALDLSRPLPAGWAVGARAARDDRQVLVPVNWFDPFHRRRLWQIRSDKAWTRGFFRLQSDSIVTVRYRARDSGPGQVCFCVRTPDFRSPYTGMLEWNGTYEVRGADANGWQTLELRACDLIHNDYRPTFGPPWIGFLIIFNTWDADLGLEVGEFRVTPPGPPGGHPD
jgi:hypothetical protein